MPVGILSVISESIRKVAFWRWYAGIGRCWCTRLCIAVYFDISVISRRTNSFGTLHLKKLETPMNLVQG